MQDQLYTEKNNKSSSHEELLKEKWDLEDRCYALECSDDLLFVNGSGNLSLYESYHQRIREINVQLYKGG